METLHLLALTYFSLMPSGQTVTNSIMGYWVKDTHTHQRRRNAGTLKSENISWNGKLLHTCWWNVDVRISCYYLKRSFDSQIFLFIIQKYCYPFCTLMAELYRQK